MTLKCAVFPQWWRRSVRAGVSYAQVNSLHKGAYLPERRRAWLWAFMLPVIILLATSFIGGWGLLLIGLYAVSFGKTALGLIKGGAAFPHAVVGAFFLVLSKFPNLIGIGMFHGKRLLGRRQMIIEYK